MNTEQNLTVLHQVVTNEWFLLIASIASIASFVMAFFAVKKVTNIEKSIKQTQTGGTNNQQAGGDIHNV